MNRSHTLHSLASLLLGIMAITTTARAQVPEEWTTARRQITAKLAAIGAGADARWDGAPWCASFGGNILLANGNRGYQLFSQTPPSAPVPAHQSVLLAKIDTMMMAYARLGYKAVDITIQYPMLVDGFPHSADYLGFYKRVYALARSHGLKIVEGCQSAFVDSTFGEKYLARDVSAHYLDPDGNPATDDVLDAARYKREKLQMLQTIIDSLAPDYLTLENEPQTQSANLSNLVPFTPDSVLSYIHYFTAGLNRHATLLGAGAGSWDRIEYFTGAASTDIDFIDYHIYPVNFGYVDDAAFRIDSIADAHDKRLMIGEAWCYKVTDQELRAGTNPVATAQTVYARDVFDYWQDVDALFIATMIKLARQSKVELVNLFWSTYMFGQIHYDPAVHGGMTPAQILAAGSQAAYEKLFRYELSPIGVQARAAIAAMCAAPSGIAPDPVEESGITLRPGTAPGTIAISLPPSLHGPLSVTIADLLGREMGTITVEGGRATSGPLERGLYLVSVRDGERTLVGKIVVR